MFNVENKEMKSILSHKSNFFRKALALALTLASLTMPFASIPVNPTKQVYADTAEISQVFAFNTAGQVTWTAPSNVTSVLVTTWGAGGAGGNGIKNDSGNSAGQGGGAGGYAQGQIYITPGSTHTITVGSGGSSTGGDRNGGSSSFDSSVVASGGIGGANWDEISGNNGNGGNNGGGNPQPSVVNTECAFEGTWVYNDQGGSSGGPDANDFAVTCRNAKLTGFCNVGPGMFAGTMSRGFHPGNYVCEQGVTPEVGTKCDFDGTWEYNDDGSGNDFAFTCRTGKVTGYCGSTNLPRGVNPGIYTCEYGQPVTTDAPACNFSGTWGYTDEGSGNDFAISCKDSKMTTWCGSTDLSRGLHSGDFMCQNSVQTNAPVDNSDINWVGGRYKYEPLPVNDPGISFVSKFISFFKPAVAYAQVVFNGQGGNGIAGTELRSGESASPISFVNGLPYASSGGAASNGGAGGSRGRLGKDGGGDCVGFACDLAGNGVQPGGGGGGSDTGFGGNGGNGYVLVQIMGVQFPDSDLPTTGHLDSADCSVIAGWAYDTNDTSVSVDVQLYADGPRSIGNLIGIVPTNNNRSDVNAFAGITGVHGFIFNTPDSLKDGGTHQIFAYAVNSDPSHSYNNMELASPAPLYVSGCSNGGGGNVNQAPTGLAVSGPTTGVVNTSYSFLANAVDPEGNQIRYGFDWNNDGIIDEYTAFGNSGVAGSASHTFTTTGTYPINVYAEDQAGLRSAGVTHTIVISGGGGGNVNQAPGNISITGPLNGSVNTSYAFTATAIDPESDNIEYGFDWDNSGAINGTESWTPATVSGVSATRSNIWSTPGVKTFQVIVRDALGAQASASASITISGGSSNNSFTVAPLTGLTTSEVGATSPFTVVLDSAPLANVTFSVNSSDWTEGTTSVNSLVFTPANWNVAQTVIVTGIDDGAVDGNINYTVQVGPTTSVDINFNGLAAQTVSVSNFDNDVAPNTGGNTGGSSGGGGGHGGACIGFNCSTAGSGSGSGISDILIDVSSASSGSGYSGPYAQKYCPADEFITVYLRKGINNDVNEVKKLQYFLNTYAGTSLPIDGVFATSTEDAVKSFQIANAEAILTPWGVTEPTGIVYITTTNAINRIFCGANPTYQGNLDLKDILGGDVLNTPTDNSGEFEGQIGANATNTSVISNVAGLFGAFSQGLLDLLKDIPWYALLITLLTVIGSGIIAYNIFKKDISSKAGQMSLIEGIVFLSIASVLNVLNAMSFIINPAWLTSHTGLTLSGFLELVILNLVALITVAVSVIIAFRRKNLAPASPEIK